MDLRGEFLLLGGLACQLRELVREALNTIEAGGNFGSQIERKRPSRMLRVPIVYRRDEPLNYAIDRNLLTRNDYIDKNRLAVMDQPA